MITTLPEAPQQLMTLDEFMVLADDEGVDRMLIQGRLWERPVTRRNRWHAACEAAISRLIGNWVMAQPKPRGMVFSGEAGFVLRGTPASAVGIDVAYASYEVVSRSDHGTRMVDGPPILAVEILSPSDKQEEVLAKVREYLDVGVPLTWVVEPVFQTVTVYRPNDRPKLYSGTDVLTGENQMPGFSITVQDIFEN
ncbi:MAG: Uma2 family endonuclease [Planctomycetaceae bacterium]